MRVARELESLLIAGSSLPLIISQRWRPASADDRAGQVETEPDRAAAVIQKGLIDRLRCRCPSHAVPDGSPSCWMSQIFQSWCW